MPRRAGSAPTSASASDRLLTAALAAAAGCMALSPRLRDLSATMVLADTVGPFLAAAREGWRPHAPPYGWGLYPPYALILALAGSLSQAMGLLALLHALSAPLAVLAVLQLRPRAWGAAAGAGALVAWDRGLLDTTLSGAEGYLAAPWLAAATLGLAARDRPLGPWLAATAWAFAVLCHPFALAAAPLLAVLPRRPSSLPPLLLAAAMLAPRAVQALSGDAPTAEGDPWSAPGAWWDQAGPGGLAVLLAPVLGLCSRRSRGLSLLALASLALMLGLGLHLGYLRDHHLRLLTVPLVVGIAALPRAWGLLFLLALRAPPSQAQAPGIPERPGTLGMAERLGAQLAALPGPVVVDGAWVGGALVAEPAALMLDLHLRGHALGGEQVAVVLSTRPRQVYGLDLPGQRLDRHDHHALVLLPAADLAAWAPALCAAGARLGGAADGRALVPDLPVPSWGCQE